MRIVIVVALLLLSPASADAAATAVAPFANATGDANLNTLCYGLPDLLSAVLGSSTNLHVVDRSVLNAVIAEQGLSFTQSEASGAGVKMGRLIKADTVLTGSFMEAGTNRVRVAVQVIDVETAAILKSVTRDGAIFDLGLLCEGIACDVGDVLADDHLDFAGADIDEAPTANLHIMRGLEFYWRGEHLLAVASFMRARDIAPHHRDAAFWTARAYVAAENWAHGLIELSRFAEDFADDPRMPEVKDLRKMCLSKMTDREKLLLLPKQEGAENAP